MLEDIKHSGMFYRKDYINEKVENIIGYIHGLVKDDKDKKIGFSE